MKRIYFDTFVWIALAQTFYRKNNSGEDKQALKQIQHQVEAGLIELPLSLYHCMEMLKGQDHERRKRLWKFAVNLCGCNALMSAHVVLDSFIEAAVYKVFDISLNRPHMDIFSKSGFFGLDFSKTGEETSEYSGMSIQTKEGWQSFWLDIPEETRAELIQNLSEYERVFILRRNELKDKFRNDDRCTRRGVYKTRLFLDHQEIYNRYLSRIGKSIRDIEALDMADRFRLVTEVPPFDIEVALAIQHQQQWDRPEKESDVRDMLHLRMAVPFCDIVITERYWVDKMKREGLDKKYETLLLSNVHELLEHI